ncbi:MAG: LuxR C-terminal-related transcriptional regulator [Planctomycetota bacterium]
MSKATPASPAVLTARERAAVPLFIQDVAVAELAAALACTPEAAEALRADIFRKLRVRDRAGLADWALRHGVI